MNQTLRTLQVEGDIAGTQPAQGEARCLTSVEGDIADRKHAEDVLSASEAKYRALVEQAADAIIVSAVTARGLVIEEVNSTACEMHGYRRDELVGRYLADMVDPEDLAKNPFDFEALRTERTTRNERLLLRKDGTTLPVETNTRLLADGRLQSIVRDISERKLAEEALRASEGRFQAFWQYASDAMSLSDPEGIVLAANPAYCELYGYSPQEVIGQSFAIIFPSAVREWAVREYKRTFADTEIPPTVEATIERRDGEQRIVEVRYNFTQVGGRRVAMISLIRDITARKQTEKALLQSDRELNDFFDNSVVGLHWVGPDGTILRANQAELDLLGYTREEYIGRQIAEFHDDQDAIQDILRRLTGGEAVHGYEARLRCKDGSTRHVLISSNVLWDDDGNFVHTRCFTRDITERKRVEEALEETLSLLRATLESTADGILVTDGKGIITNSNKRFMELWGIPEEVLATRDNYQALAFVISQLRDPQAFLRKVQELRDQPDMDSFDTMEFTDGRIFERYSTAQRIGDRIVGRVWSFRDVTERQRASEALQASESRYRTVIEQASEGIFLADTKGRLTDVNELGCEMLGYTRDELLRLSIDDIVEPSDPEIIQARIVELASGKILRAEHLMCRKDGTTFPVETSSKLLPDGTYQGFVRDITERKQAAEALKKAKADLELRVADRTAELHESNRQLQHELSERIRTEQALLQSEERFRAIFEHAPVMIDSFTEDGHCTLWNVECEKQLGYTKEEVLATGDSLRLFYPDKEIRDRVMESIVRKDGRFRDFGVRASNGTTRHQMWANFALPNMEVISIGYDVTERKIAEERLRRSEEMYRALARNLPNGAVLMFDADLRFQLAEGTALRTLGYSPEQMIGKPIWEVLPPQRCEELVPYYRAALDGQESVIEVESGQPTRINLVHFVPVKNEHGETFGGMAVSVDITEQKRFAEEARLAQNAAEQANRAKSEFLSRMSHELRTPLNSILGFSQLLEVGDLPAKQTKYVSYVLNAGEHLLALINEVLDIASVEAGHSHLSMGPVAVQSAIQECLDLMQPLAARRKVNIDTGNYLEQPWHVLADRQRLLQVLLNIIANAVKYNKEGGSVVLSCYEVGERLRIQVSDTGHGISETKMDKLFTPFQRLGAEQTGVEGSGLGLTLSRSLVEAMHGNIGVESIVGQGSTFWVELAIVEDQPGQLEKLQTNPLAWEVQPAKSRTVLYVEDNLSNVNLVEGIVESWGGVKLLVAMQGSLALEIAQQQQPDLILLDLHLPDISGEQVLRRLKDDLRTRSIPVVIVSADAMSSGIVRLREAGARDYLTKPLSVKKLLLILDEVFNEAT